MSTDFFAALRALDLPAGRYVVTGSGPLAARGLRAPGDVDVMVDEDLFDVLAAEHGPADGGRLELPGGIEAFREDHFAAVPGLPPVREQIAAADHIDGLPFLSLEHLEALKRAQDRPKDRADLELIRRWRER